MVQKRLLNYGGKVMQPAIGRKHDILSNSRNNGKIGRRKPRLKRERKFRQKRGRAFVAGKPFRIGTSWHATTSPPESARVTPTLVLTVQTSSLRAGSNTKTTSIPSTEGSSLSGSLGATYNKAYLLRIREITIL